MLKSKLTSEPEDNLKGAYIKSGDEWVLDQLSADHPKMVENKTLIDEKRAVETERDTFKANATNLERERDEAKRNALPSGHYAVKKEVKEAGESAIAAGFDAETVKGAGEKLTAYETEKTEVARKADLTKAFKFAEVTNLDEAFNRKATDGLKIEWKTVDGVQKPYVIGEKDGQKTETLFDEKYLSETEGFASGAAALFAAPKETFEFPGEAKPDAPKNEWDAYRAEGKAASEKKEIAPTSNIFAAAAK